jgi:astacin
MSRPYTVQAGDTLYKIAQSQLGDGNRWRDIKDASGNSFTDESAKYIRPGDVIQLP